MFYFFLGRSPLLLPRMFLGFKRLLPIVTTQTVSTFQTIVTYHYYPDCFYFFKRLLPTITTQTVSTFSLTIITILLQMFLSIKRSLPTITTQTVSRLQTTITNSYYPECFYFFFDNYHNITLNILSFNRSLPTITTQTVSTFSLTIITILP
jgi:hypothetical protein